MGRMLYKFKSRATGDLIMLQPHGDQLLRLLGREAAPQGVFEVAAMPAMLSAIEQAIADEERRVAAEAADDDEPGGPRAVGLRQRLWPMVEMMRRAHLAGERIVWGV